jgi:hypothetical protein
MPTPPTVDIASARTLVTREAQVASSPTTDVSRLVRIGGLVVFVAGAFWAGRMLESSPGALAAMASSVTGGAAMLIIGSVVEWWVHGRLMHRRQRSFPGLHLAYDLHHRAHHWTHYPPDRYLQDEVSYVPLVPPEPERACRTRSEEVIAAVGQGAFYAAFAGPPVLAAWELTHNVAFAVSFSIVAAGIVFFAVHIHDAVHCPGHSPFERFGWFKWLDEHHYLHHVDTRTNVNFLLPLGDFVFGTLRREMTPAEQRRWPSYLEARAAVRPSCKREVALRACAG